MLRPYERLASVYSEEWGKFSSFYVRLVDYIQSRYNFIPSIVLDVACGTGDLLAQLHQNGYQVIGIDNSPEMVEASRTKNPDSMIHLADMTEFDLAIKVDIATCTFDSINYLLTEEQLLKAFVKIYNHLNLGGFFLFDVNTPRLYKYKHHGMIEKNIHGVRFLQMFSEFDSETDMAKIQFYFGNGQIENHVQRAYSKKKIDQFLRDSDFQILESFHDREMNPSTENSYKVFYIVRKPGSDFA